MGNVDEGIRRTGYLWTSLSAAMSTQRKNAGTALQSSTAAADAPQIPTISMVRFSDAYDLGCELQRKRVECAIMIKAALADKEEN